MNECCEQATADLRAEVERQKSRADDFEGRYETSHASRMHAENCYHRAEAEVATLRETLRRVEALADQWDAGMSAWGTCGHEWTRLSDLRAALAQPAQEGQG